MSTRAIGRLFWTSTITGRDDYPSPWVEFPNKTAFEKWRRDVRKARPGTKTEWAYLNLYGGPERLLEGARESQARKDAEAAWRADHHEAPEGKCSCGDEWDREYDECSSALADV
jgi:hypothetical protein